MPERLLLLTAAGDASVPSRVCSLLVQRKAPLRRIWAAHDEDGGWSLLLAVDLAEHARVALLIEQLNRLVDVVKTVEVAPAGGHEQQSRFGVTGSRGGGRAASAGLRSRSGPLTEEPGRAG